ncbi:thymine dioxygenase [Roridomyces roridus]|uniref:Thymine dioxygenase n=1 Tax=Roridomyces roridus TaxID=1738132 RepID=A0AAD7BF71_9AGAR|nr:thymine dioxygenase [Roridomyces roridus]
MPPVDHILQDSGISVVDFSGFLDGSNKQAVASAIVDSFKRVGFVYLLNHGISKERAAKMFAVSKEFFDQPMDVKQLAPHPPSGEHHRGYSAPGREKVVQYGYGEDLNLAQAEGEAPDFKEHFECGSEPNVGCPNIWLPDGALPGFKETCLDFYYFCYGVQLNILRALAVGLGIEEEYFLQYHSSPDENQLRLLHYPSVSADTVVGRISAHSDYASITLLLQDDTGGLEIEDPHEPGVFRPAPPINDALIVNAGDFLMRWSNDTIKSTIHRVRAPATLAGADGMIPARYSLPYFCAADPDTVVDCIPGTWDDAHPKKYEPISAGEYVRKRLAAAY